MNTNEINFDIIRARSEMYEKIRQFFNARKYLEVETPVLSNYATVDVNIDSFTVETSLKPFYLTTSPEFHMKRLLAAGSGSIYQICKAYRTDESGTMHNPEFSILEWYKLDVDDLQLINEMKELIRIFLPEIEFHTFTYSEIFNRFTSIDPIEATILELQEYCRKSAFTSSNRDELIDFIWVEYIEPNLSQFDALFIIDYPANQAALAKLKLDDKRFAHRFELFLYGIELANGFYELTDAKEQEIRFIIDQQKRESRNKSVPPFDQNLIKAMETGLPDCSGVALGLDRLLMILENKQSIDEVIPFTITLA